MERSKNINTEPIHTGTKHFKFFTDLDKILLEQDTQNAEQKAWQEHDDSLPIGELAVGEVDIPANPYL